VRNEKLIVGNPKGEIGSRASLPHEKNKKWLREREITQGEVAPKRCNGLRLQDNPTSVQPKQK